MVDTDRVDLHTDNSNLSLFLLRSKQLGSIRVPTSSFFFSSSKFFFFFSLSLLTARKERKRKTAAVDGVLKMNRLLDWGRKVVFYARVLSGYEERRIRSYRLQLEQRLRQAQAKKTAVNKVPEQIILSEVRRMVEEMQALNKKMEETEAAIEDYFKPLDKEAEIIMKIQLEGEEKSMREMMKTMQEQALLQKAEAEKSASVHKLDESQTNQDPSSNTTSREAEIR